jgi:biopolymer transport protein ExbD
MIGRQGLWHASLAFALLMLVGCANEADTPVRQTTVDVRHVGQTDQFFVDGQSVSLRELAEQTLEHAIEDNPAMAIAHIYDDARIVVRSDPNVLYEVVQEVMVRLRTEGFENLCLEVRGRATCAAHTTSPSPVDHPHI